MLTRLFCEIDDFCQGFLPHWKASVLEPPTPRPKRNRPCGLSLSEVMTIWVHYHQSGYHTFKWYYLKHVQVYLKSAFPQLPSYQRFIERVPDVLVPLTRFMQSRCEASRGIAFIDSTPLRVCDNIRIPRHKNRRTREVIHRLVLWLQAASRGERSRRHRVLCLKCG